MPEDRLPEIKARPYRTIAQWDSDLSWLIKEVDRLKFELEMEEQANLANGQMVAKMAGYVPPAEFKMATVTRLLSIHPTQDTALASLAFSARPWAVVVPKRAAEKGVA